MGNCDLAVHLAVYSHSVPILVGSNSVMGLAFGRDGKLYATDWTQNSGLYLIDIKTGFETAIAALPFGLSSGLELAGPLPRPEDRDE